LLQYLTTHAELPNHVSFDKWLKNGSIVLHFSPTKYDSYNLKISPNDLAEYGELKWIEAHPNPFLPPKALEGQKKHYAKYHEKFLKSLLMQKIHHEKRFQDGNQLIAKIQLKKYATPAEISQMSTVWNNWYADFCTAYDELLTLVKNATPMKEMQDSRKKFILSKKKMIRIEYDIILKKLTDTKEKIAEIRKINHPNPKRFAQSTLF
jgi:hypothetical protein